MKKIYFLEAYPNRLKTSTSIPKCKAEALRQWLIYWPQKSSTSGSIVCVCVCVCVCVWLIYWPQKSSTSGSIVCVCVCSCKVCVCVCVCSCKMPNADEAWDYWLRCVPRVLYLFSILPPPNPSSPLKKNPKCQMPTYYLLAGIS